MVASGHLRTSPLSDDDSDFSDFEPDEADLESETVNNNWLDEVDEVVEVVPSSPSPKCSFADMLKGKTVHQRAYVTNNSGLYHALCSVEDLEFANLVPAIQIVLMKSLLVQRFQPGEKIFSEGDFSFPFYIIVASDETADTACVEVLKDAGGSERLMTRLHRGQYFGQKYFLTKQRRVRSATVRVPFDSVSVDIACLMPEQFSIWDSYRNVLLVQGVPLIQSVPRGERVAMISQAQIREFREGEYIIKQGEVGEELFIILEGACDVVEDKNITKSSSKDDKDKLSIKDKEKEKDKDGKEIEKVPNIVKLVTLREGHFFGEMSLMSNNPRMASVVANCPSICLSLTKTVFRNALSAESFAKVLSTVLDERKKARKRRQSASRQKMLQAALGAGKKLSASERRQSSPLRRSRSETPSIALAESPVTGAATSVTLTSSVKMRKLSSGDKLVNKYLVVKELGKGATGEVYMVRDEETGQPYAMKVTNRYTAGWSDENSGDRSIAQEIAVMKKLQHQNIVNLVEVIDDPKNRKIFLVQELMEGGALMPDSENCEPVANEVAWMYFRDIVAGLAYLHSEGVIHRDIKPQNILLTADGIAKIADFGAAVFMDDGEGKVAYAGTPAFMSPELFMSSEAAIEFSKSPAIDIFALGATLYCMVVGHPPWMANNQIDLANQIISMDLVFPEGIILDPHLKHLLRRMLDKDHKSRIDLDGIVEDDWVTHEGVDPFFFDGGPGTPPTLFDSDQDLEAPIMPASPTQSLLRLAVDVSESLMSVSPRGGTSPAHARQTMMAHFPKPKGDGTVLVVDDSPVARKLLAIQVERVTGYTCQAAASGIEAVNILSELMKNGGTSFDAILIDHAMTHSSSLKEGRERVSLDGPATALAIRQCGYTGRIIGMCGSTGGVLGESRTDFMDRGGVVIILKKPLDCHQLKEAIMDTAEESVISQRFMQKRDLLQIEDISTAIKRLSLQAITPGTDSSRNSPLNSDRSTGELRGIQFELEKLAALPSPKTTSQIPFGSPIAHKLSDSESAQSLYSTASMRATEGQGQIKGSSCKSSNNKKKTPSTTSMYSFADEALADKDSSDENLSLAMAAGHILELSKKTHRESSAESLSLTSLEGRRSSKAKAESNRGVPLSTSTKDGNTSYNSNNNTNMNKASTVTVSRPSPVTRGQSIHFGDISLDQEKSRSNPFRNDFQYTVNYESGNYALIKNADRLGKPTTELSLTSPYSSFNDRKYFDGMLEEERGGAGGGREWGSSMPSESRRGSYTSANNSSHSSIDSTGLSQSTVSNSRSVNDSNGDSSNLLGSTLFLEGMPVPAAGRMRSTKGSNSSLFTPPLQERTLTRTQDFMVVPSEVVYGPGGEKINKGIAYTALDGRMSSSFKIPTNSSYQEEVEARRQKRERAMIKSKLMRPDSDERDPSSMERARLSRVRGSRGSVERSREGSRNSPSGKTNSASSSGNGSGNPLAKKKSGMLMSKVGANDSAAGSFTTTLSPQSSVNISSYNLSRVPSGDVTSVLRPRGGSLGMHSQASSTRRRESITSLGSFDSLGIQFIRDREIEADFDSDVDGQRVNKLDDYSASPGTKLSKRVEGSFPYKVGSSNGSKVSSPGGRVVSANVLSLSSEKTCHSMVSLEAIGEANRCNASASIDAADQSTRHSVRFSGSYSPSVTSSTIFRPLSVASCVSGMSDVSTRPQGTGAGTVSPPLTDLPLPLPLPKQKHSLYIKKTLLLGSRSLDNFEEEEVGEWNTEDCRGSDIGNVTTRSEYVDKCCDSPKSYQDIDTDQLCDLKGLGGVRRTKSDGDIRAHAAHDSDMESLEGAGFEKDGGRRGCDEDDSDDDSHEGLEGEDEDSGGLRSSAEDDDDDDDDGCDGDLGEEIVQLDDDLLASALEDLCVQRPRGDPSDSQWNTVNGSIEVSSYLLCPAGQENLKLGIRFSKAEAIGGRQYMEDRIYAAANLSIDEENENADLAYFGVFDGHNGEYVADLLQKRMHVALQSHINAVSVTKASLEGGCAVSPTTASCRGEGDLSARTENSEMTDIGDSEREHGKAHADSGTLGDCFVRAAAELDLQILTRDYQRQQCSLHTGTLDAQTFAGCVLATMTVTSAPVFNSYKPLSATPNGAVAEMSWVKKDKPPRWIRTGKEMTSAGCGVNVMVGHTGDCRAVLSMKGGVARVLTADHKPQLPSEKERIEVAGGWVHNNRVNGVLAVSRSFGDIQYKTFDGSTRFLTAEEEGGIWSKTQQVISKPDILEFSLDVCHEFVVIASDGLWDVFTAQECINFVRWQLKKQEGDLTKTSEALLSAAFVRGTSDNTSAIIVAFNQKECAEERRDLATSVCPIVPPNAKLARQTRP